LDNSKITKWSQKIISDFYLNFLPSLKYNYKRLENEKNYEDIIASLQYVDDRNSRNIWKRDLIINIYKKMIIKKIYPTDNTFIMLASLNIDVKLLNNIAMNFVSNLERRSILNSKPTKGKNNSTSSNDIVKNNMNIIKYKINVFIKEFMDSTSVLLNNSSEEITRSSQLQYIFGLIDKPSFHSHQLNCPICLQGIINLGIIYILI
jgi:hypothetical protein